jgi:hypothetical protein
MHGNMECHSFVSGEKCFAICGSIKNINIPIDIINSILQQAINFYKTGIIKT